MYKIIISKKAQKEIASLPTYIQESVDRHILALSENPRPQGCVKLEGYSNAYRIRIGKYRVVYIIDDGVLMVTIVGVRHRKEAYDDL
jgi:mRNA interferase RelE/StbE